MRTWFYGCVEGLNVVIEASEKISGWTQRRATISRRIELAALELCLSCGIDAVTVEEIATKAGISRRTFYRYFDTIEDILTASPRRALERISVGVRERPPEVGVRRCL